MDFWDLIRTLWTRRAVTVPLLLLTAMAGVYVGLNTQPDYRATGHVSVVAPTTRDGSPANPWDVQTMTGILAVQLQSNPSVKQRLEAEGLVGDYTLAVERSLDQPLPIIKIDATAHDAAAAQAMLNRLVEITTETLAAHQKPAGLRSGEAIRLVAVAPEGGTVAEVRTTAIRSLVVVLLAGLILTAGVATGIDALARRRAAGADEEVERRLEARRRGAERGNSRLTAPTVPYVPMLAHQPGPATAPPHQSSPYQSTQHQSTQHQSTQHQSSQHPLAQPVPQPLAQPPMRLAQQPGSMASTPPQPLARPPAAFPTGAAGPDATIVLPLTGLRPTRGGPDETMEER